MTEIKTYYLIFSPERWRVGTVSPPAGLEMSSSSSSDGKRNEINGHASLQGETLLSQST